MASVTLHSHGSTSSLPTFDKKVREVPPQTQAYAVHGLENIFRNLAGIQRLNADFIKGAVKDCGEYLNFAAMAAPHLKSGEQGCVAVFGSSRSKELDQKGLFQVQSILSRLINQKGEPGSQLTVHGVRPKKLGSLLKIVKEFTDKPADLPIAVTEQLVAVLNKIYSDRSPRLRTLISHNPESLSQLRTKFNMHWGYKKSMEMGASLEKAGYMVMSGGGPGSMEGSCRGANPEQRLDASVIAVAINIPGEPGNPYIPGHGPGHQELVNFDSSLDRRAELDKFTMRKWGLVHESNGLIVLPGGYGTNEEFSEVLSLISGGNIDQPVCFVGKRFWSPIIRMLKETGFITKDLAAKISVVDNTDEAVDKITGYYERNHSVDGKIIWPKRWENLDEDLNRDFLVKRKILPSGEITELFSFPKHDLEKLDPESQMHIKDLLKVAQDEISKVISNCPHADQMTPKMLTGFLKFLVDSLNIGAKMAELNIENPVLLLGDQNRVHFQELKQSLTSNGVAIVQKIGDGENGGIGITVTIPDPDAGSEYSGIDIDIPARIRAMALDVAAGKCNKIFVADGGIRAFHRTFQYLCWIQTEKMKDTELVVIDPYSRFARSFKTICDQSENFGCTKRSERGFVQIFRSREEAVAAGHIELAS